MSICRRLFFVLTASLLSMNLSQAADSPDFAQIKKSLRELIPDAEPDSIKPAPVAGLYEIVFGPQVFYATEDGRYLVQGNILDMEKRVNITEARRADARLAAVSGLGEENMIIFAPAKVKHTVTVFTDIDCGYCRKLHSEMDQYKREGIRVRYLLFPRNGMASESADKAISVWCAKDRNAALTQAKAGEEVDKKTCDNPVQQHYSMGELVGVSGTPAILTDKGELVPGYVAAGELSNMLEGKSRR